MSKQPHILVVDDEPKIRMPLKAHLETHGFIASEAEDAAQARSLLTLSTFDLIILDIMMPGEDGLSLCRHVLESLGTPVIFLTALGDDIDRIDGLELGADDYVTKPFNPRELLARIRSVLRRAGSDAPKAELASIIAFGDWQLDTSRAELTHTNKVIETLSSGELSVLKVFLANVDAVLSRDRILSLTKGREAFPFERSIDIMISRLRHKIEVDPSDPQYIKTIWGGGYKFAVPIKKP